MQIVNPQDQAADSVFDVVIPSLGKRFGDCTGTELKRVGKKLLTAGKAALRKERQLALHAEGKPIIPEIKIRRLLSEARQIDPDFVAMDRIEEILKQRRGIKEGRN